MSQLSLPPTTQTGASLRCGWGNARLGALKQRVAQEQTRLWDENLALQERTATLEAEMTA